MDKAYGNLTIIIPTLNEQGNIGRVIRVLGKMYPGVRIIVADDGSVDNTKKEVIAASKRFNVQFFDRMHMQVHGLTASVIDAALRVRTDYIIVMDGDMQHPPELVGSMYRKLLEYDIVIGVRVEVKDWGLHRVILSRGMAIISYVVFKARGKPVTRDMMSGFFGIRSGIIKALARRRRKDFVMHGYKVLLDILRMADREVSICEVEYSTFHRRIYGRSKLKLRRMAEVLESTFRG